MEQGWPQPREATWLPGAQGLTHALGEGLGDSGPRADPYVLSSRAVSGVDADPDLVHMEAQDLGGGKPGGVRAPSVPLCPYVPLFHSSAGPAQPTSLCYDVA